MVVALLVLILMVPLARGSVAGHLPRSSHLAARCLQRVARLPPAGSRRSGPGRVRNLSRPGVAGDPDRSSRGSRADVSARSRAIAQRPPARRDGDAPAPCGNGCRLGCGHQRRLQPYAAASWLAGSGSPDRAGQFSRPPPAVAAPLHRTRQAPAAGAQPPDQLSLPLCRLRRVWRLRKLSDSPPNVLQ